MDYSNPTRECDLVMKGGITSGVVYPLAIAEIAGTYRLRQVGGTSAGAIAAGGAVAAEVGRDSDDGGFERLTELTDTLAGPAGGGAKGSLMQNLFQPQQATKPTFEVLAGWMFSTKGKLGKALALVGNAARHHPAALLLGLLPGLAVIAATIAWADGAMVAVGVVAGAALALVIAPLVVAGAIAIRALSSLKANNFGLCNGSTEEGAATPGLTEFLADEIDRLAGRDPASNPPLTFRDLKTHGVRLNMLATNVTQSVPVLLPEGLSRYFYEPKEFRKLFPERVVKHMEENPRSGTGGSSGLVRMPEADDLPVIGAVRMSLSFPVLLSALPLWDVDYKQEKKQMATNWISDGGITSNFPTHFFDSPLPSRPTFAINLAPTLEAAQNEAENVKLPKTAGSGIANRWTDIDGMFGFMRAVFDTMQNWADNQQTHIAGYRDRIATVSHTAEEGGLNLNMDPVDIGRLAERGRIAGALFTDQFDFVSHRWIRYRSVMELLEDYIGRYRAGWGAVPVGDGVPRYAEMVEGPPPASYRGGEWTGPKADFFRTRSECLVKLAIDWPDSKGTHSFAKDAPHPKATLRVTPAVPTSGKDD
jgi:predicted acylesterase/phospholipase RssA